MALFKKIAEHQHHPATDVLLHAVGFYANFYSALYPHVAEIHGCFGHDVLAFIYLTNPELFTTESGRVRVATSGLAQGQTMLRRKAIDYAQAGWDSSVGDTTVCMQVQADACRAVLEQTLLGNWLGA